MAWINQPLPDCIAFGAVAETSWNTIVAEQQSGVEQRTLRWTAWRLSYDLSFATRVEAEWRQLREHFAMARGKLNSFPMRDFTDYQVDLADGRAAYVSPGVFALYKNYGDTPDNYLRRITRPVIFAPSRNGTPMVAGAGAGQYAVGALGTFSVQPDQTRSISSHVVGATHRFNLTDFSPNVVPGNTVYASGISGTAASLLNGVPLTVATVGSGFLTVAVNTTGLTATGGTAARRAMPSEITWLGTFNVPVRYDIDTLRGQAIDRNPEAGLLIQTTGVMVIEVREDSP